MYATISVNVKKSSESVGKNITLSVWAVNAETCLSLLTSKLYPLLSYSAKLTFRPVDGVIFLDGTAPVGVLYRQPYLLPN